MKVLIAGSSGLIGDALVSHFESKGDEIVRLVRTPGEEGTIFWDVHYGILDADALEGFDAVINLAGANVAEKRWTSKRKTEILESRVFSTILLCKRLAGLKKPPKVLINASAVGFYGNQGSSIVDESSLKGNGVLADVCRKWEASTSPIKDKGIRLVLARFGIVLSPKGGALKKMLLPFRLGLGGKIGAGDQWMSWVAIEDVVKSIEYLINNEDIQGAVNICTPNPVTNEEFTKILGNVLHRPTLLSVPAFAVRLVFGEMADEMLLASTKVSPRRLVDSGYVFQYPELESTLRHYLH
jgi:hypothetical protein